MRTYQGTLRELGQSESGRSSQTRNYTYIEVGDQMLKKLKVFNGLDGKVNNALGEPVTLHVDGSFVVAITTQDGKTYSAEKFGFGSMLVAWVFLIAGVPFSFLLIGIPFALIGARVLYINSKISAGANLPNAIQIPII